MVERETKTWSRIISTKDVEIKRAVDSAHVAQSRLFHVTNQLLEAQSGLLKWRQKYRDLEEHFSKHRERSCLEATRLQQLLERAERLNSRNNAAVEELCDRVTSERGFAALPHNSTYLPEPVAKMTSGAPETHTDLDRQDMAYIATVLGTLTAELGQERKERQEVERNFQDQIAFLSDQVARRDLLLGSHIFQTSHSVPSSSTGPDAAQNSATTSLLPQADPGAVRQAAYNLDRQNLQLEEEVERLTLKLDRANQKSRKEGGAASSEQVEGADHSRLEDTTFDRDMEVLRMEVRRVGDVVANLRSHVEITGSGEREEKEINLIDISPTEGLDGGETALQRVPRQEPPHLEQLDGEIASLSEGLQKLQTERSYLSMIGSPPPQLQDGQTFAARLLLEEECIRLQRSEENLLRELAIVTERLRACEARHGSDKD